ncbi:4-hydroxybenzoate 3-monooxygenase [Wenxinia saemankumensis]|uniref:p-hydroxybenzoate 3-monooxygenase n=1 Tax=Wenxinia saemankumensis TaxID=1447782 RepID=A0A1M6AAD0_9RHOB|nr:4-hydroxybenzoate 3-monooxygenase [Wenxinia saemankumensis]SHI33435.1 p-hydroxybenzoate 3-monooxygenase [Wenxinia saemankumensis]
MTRRRTQVCVIGGGPSGLLLSHRLHRAGIDTIVIERRTKAHVLSRIRAGVLEAGLVAQLREIGCAGRLDAEGQVHGGCVLSVDSEAFRVDFAGLTGQGVVVYGQTEVTRDLFAAKERAGETILFGVEDVALHDPDGAAPFVTFRQDGIAHRVDCDWIAGCDGFHGPSRQAIPRDRRREVEKVYPFGWLGILSETPPVHDELIYASSDRGFALCSMRSAHLSRYYVQVPTGTDPASWSDERFWDELRARIPPERAEALVTGPAIEKSVAPLRSFVCETMRWGRLLLLGDAAHIVPPTGAKGLNTAASDVHYAFEALHGHYGGSQSEADHYAARALARVWKAERFSWWMTTLLHRFPGRSDFDRRMQEAEIALLRDDDSYRRAMARNYVGLPYS